MTTMTNKKKESTSTESSSGSSSDSSSSSSSSSGSDSSSSSDSESSSSQASAKQSGTEAKKSQPAQKNVKKNTDTSKTSLSAKHDPKLVCKSKPVPSKNSKSTTKIEISSSEDDQPSKSAPSNSAPKKKTPIKPKPSSNAPQKTATTKTPPSRLLQKSQALTNNKSAPKTAKINKSQAKTASDKDDKKKSIFSPENTSEDSDIDTKGKTPAKPLQKTIGKVIKKPPPMKTPPVKKQPPANKSSPKPKPEVTSISPSSDDGSSSSNSSSSSETESSAQSTASTRKNFKSSVKTKTGSKQQNSNSDSDMEAESRKATRKSTRSANTRKSKHLLGKNIFSDTDSDTESTKRDSSRSPVKKAPVSTKGNAKNKRSDVKNRASEILIKEERKCPSEGCNSLGHLSGKLDKHFTLEACPNYHNVTPIQCKEELIERRKREENRRKGLEIFKKSPKPSTAQDQKQYLQKIKDMRSKFKFEPPSDMKTACDKSREPILDDFVPEYDLKLFRDAQALSSEKIEEDLKSQPNTKGTKYIEMGKFEMEVWYQSPYPEDYARLPKLYICEFCLRYMKSRTVLQRHIVKCVWRHPPGEEVYRKDKISVWEVDGKRYKQYCQNLCLLAKFFLDHKTLYYDVEPFLFYVMTMYDTEGCHTVGYFSKEKNSFLNYNVSCILTLPPYQRQGYGRLLIDFSYLLTRVEGKIGSPEKPLSDLGLISYRSYWKDVLLGYLCANSSTTLSVKDISQEMAIHSYDIVSTLQALGMMKYWKGKHIILKKQDVLDEYAERTKRRGSALKEVDRACLRWNPLQPPSA